MAKAGRTIVFKAEITAGIYSLVTGTDPPGPVHPSLDLGLPFFSFTVFGFQVRGGPKWTGSTVQIEAWYELDLIPPSGDFSGFTDHGESSHVIVMPGGSYTNDLDGGEITFTVEVEEVLTILTSGSFPSTFGPSIAHGPHKRTAWFRERPVIGVGKLIIDGSVGGASIHQSIEITADNQFFLDDPAFGYSCGQGATAIALPTATTVALSSSITFGALSPVNLSCPLTGSDHGHSVGGSSVSATAPAGTKPPPGTSGGTGHRTTASTTIWPTLDWALYTYFRALEDAYPEAVDLRVDRHANDLNALVTCPVDGSEADSYSQRRYSGSGTFEDFGPSGFWTYDMSAIQDNLNANPQWTPTGTQPSLEPVNEQADFQGGIDADEIAALAEEPEDWRCFIQCDLADQVGTLVHDTEYEIDIGAAADWDAGDDTTVTDAGGYIEIAASGGAGSATLVFDFPAHEYPPYDDWQAMLEMEVILQYDTPGTSFTLEVNDTVQTKEWEDSIPTADTDTTFTFDLRGPHNATVVTDSTQSRYYAEGWLFGVNKAVHVRFSGIPDATTLRVKSITLRRRDRSTLNFGLPTRPWLDNGVGSNYLRHVFAESYKVALEIAGMYTAVGGYGYPDIGDFFDAIEDFHPGWTATNTATAEQLVKSLMWLGGIHGAFWNGAAWVNSFGADATSAVAVWIAESADVIRWYPYMGEVGGAYGQETPMRVGKVLRSRIGAVVIDPTTHEGAIGVPVTFSGGASAAETVDTDANGYAQSEARKWGAGTAQVGENSVAVNLYNRWIAWSGFSDTTETEGCESGLSMDFSPGLRFVYACNEDGTIRLHFAMDAHRIVFESIDTGIEGDVREVRWERLSGDMRLFISYLDTDGLLWLVSTLSEGNSIEMSVQMSTEVILQQTKAIGENKIIYSYWVTEDGALKGRLLNFAGDTILPRPDETSLLDDGFVVVASSVADKDIACAVAPGEAGEFIVKLGYYGPDGLVQVSSTDGRTFS